MITKKNLKRVIALALIMIFVFSFDIPDVRAKSEALIPNGILGMPKDIASVVLFLLSDMSDYVTGTMLFADGGYHIQK